MATASKNSAAAPRIPKRFTKRRKVSFWGNDYMVEPAVAEAHIGDGSRLLFFEPANTRPHYYLIRVDSSFGQSEDDPDGKDDIEEIVDALIEEFSEIEREREYLKEDLRERGIEPDADNTDLAGNEGRLGWPALSLDSGYSWGTVAIWDGKKWKEE